jgi:hypothetical protein
MIRHSSALALLASLAFGALAPAQMIQYCTVTAAGESCGPQITITMVPQGNGGNYDLTMVATGLHPHAMGGFIWGDHPQSIVLDGGGCLSLCDYVWGHYFQTDGAGTYTFSRTWPHWAIGFYYMQMGTMTFDNNDLSVRTTNCKLVQCF